MWQREQRIYSLLLKTSGCSLWPGQCLAGWCWPQRPEEIKLFIKTFKVLFDSSNPKEANQQLPVLVLVPAKTHSSAHRSTFLPDRSEVCQTRSSPEPESPLTSWFYSRWEEGWREGSVNRRFRKRGGKNNAFNQCELSIHIWRTGDWFMSVWSSPLTDEQHNCTNLLYETR